MILKINQNTPVAAPQFSDMNAALVSYKAYTGNPALVMADLVSFIKTPGVDRDAFLASLTETVTVTDTAYAQIKYS